MNSKKALAVAWGAAMLCLVSAGLGHGQAPAPRATQAGTGEKVPLAEERFKNVQLLRGISVQEFMETMGFFSASTNLNCTGCHGDESAGSWDNYAADPPLKQTARKMMVMVDTLNKSFMGGKRIVTCYTCHRNSQIPKGTPTLAEQYATPLREDPDDISEQAPGAPPPDQVFDKYIQAIGGAQKLAGFTSFVAKGIYQGYDDLEPTPVEIYAKAPSQFFQMDRHPSGDRTWIDDGRSAWVAQPEEQAPIPVLVLGGNDLEGMHLESQLYFPARIKQLLTNLRVGFPLSGALSILPGGTGAGIDDRKLTIVQGTSAGGNKVKLYFDSQSGLLVRMVRYTSLPVGFITTEMDYSDYRDVSGIKVPFRIIRTWVDGRSVTDLASVQINVPVDAAKFTKPTPQTQPK
jgi:hypothetical protein